MSRKKTSTEPKKRGRPRKEIDWRQVDALCELQCTGPEIASVMGVCNDTMTNACKRDHGMLFSEYILQKTRPGKVKLRRSLFRLVEQGNVPATIFACKAILGMSDQPKPELTLSTQDLTKVYEVKVVDDEDSEAA